MKSPFPGMDPFIESCGRWGDFHDKIIAEMERELSRLVPSRYFVSLGSRAYIAVADDGLPGFRISPDVTVAAPTVVPNSAREPEVGQGSTAMLAADGPIAMLAANEDEYREPYIEILDSEPELKLVTTIEVLSSSNKRFGSTGWHEYLRKRKVMLQGVANFVEIDLLRQGRRMPMATPWPATPYYFLVARKSQVPSCSAWGIASLRPMPPLVVPLAPPDGDVVLPIQSLVDAIYTRSRYDRLIDYGAPPDSMLSLEEQNWLKSQLEKPST